MGKLQSLRSARPVCAVPDRQTDRRRRSLTQREPAYRRALSTPPARRSAHRGTVGCLSSVTQGSALGPYRFISWGLSPAWKTVAAPLTGADAMMQHRTPWYALSYCARPVSPRGRENEEYQRITCKNAPAGTTAGLVVASGQQNAWGGRNFVVLSRSAIFTRRT